MLLIISGEVILIFLITFLVVFICKTLTKDSIGARSFGTNYGGVNNLLEEVQLNPIETKKRYEFVSLGDHCLLALYMKKYNLRHQSYPFDWIVSNLDMVTHILKSDFKYLIDDPTYYYRYMPNLSSKDMFSHHKVNDKKTKPYMERCVNRLKNINSENLIVFIAITDNEKFNHRKYSEEDFLNIFEIFPVKIKKLVVVSFGTLKNIFTEKSKNKIDFHYFPPNLTTHAIIKPEYELPLKNMLLSYT